MSNTPIVLFRKSVISKVEQTEELTAIRSNGFDVLDLRTKLVQYPEETLVIPRFFLWPHHNEVIDDIVESGCVPINGKHATNYLRDILSYQEDLGPDLTPWSYPWNQFLMMQMGSNTNLALKACPWPTSGGFVLKTREKSMKERWSTHMFAKNFEETKLRAANLFAAGHSPEDVVVRPHVLLNKLTNDQLPGSCPVSEEYRVFVLDGKVIAAGHYWPENIDQPADMSFLDDIIPKTIAKLNPRSSLVDDLRFYVIDVAMTASGDWIVVELNDGCTAGLPANVDADSFYKTLRASL